MLHNKKNINKIFCMALIGTCLASPAFAQLINNAWSFSGQNRASIAALMKQVEDGGSGNVSGGVVAGGGSTTLICGDAGGGADGGAAGASGATGTSSCIILNNSDGAIEITQDSEGDQTANNTQEQTQNLEVGGEENVSEILEGITETN